MSRRASYHHAVTVPNHPSRFFLRLCLSSALKLGAFGQLVAQLFPALCEHNWICTWHPQSTAFNRPSQIRIVHASLAALILCAVEVVTAANNLPHDRIQPLALIRHTVLSLSPLYRISVLLV